MQLEDPVDRKHLHVQVLGELSVGDYAVFLEVVNRLRRELRR